MGTKNIARLFLIFLLFSCVTVAKGQDAGKMQELLLSKKEQEQIKKRTQEKLLLEAQKQRLQQQETQLLQLQVEKKESELNQQKVRTSARIQKDSVEAAFNAKLKDKQIVSQKADLLYSKRLMLFLISILILIFAVSVIVYRNQRKTKKLNFLISRQRDELEKVSMVKDRVLSVVGHDMRSPLNMLTSLSQLMHEGEVSPSKMKTYIAKFQATVNQTSYLMDNLLYWAASQMEGYKPFVKAIEVNRTINSVVALMETRAADKHILLTNNTPNGIFAAADEDMLSVIIRNLVGNAIKFTPANGAVEIKTTEQNDTVIITVNDNGKGMSTSLIRDFNQTNLQATISTPGTAEEKGTGLGLLLCKTFIQLMHGEIKASNNRNGKGCRFEIVLANGKAA